MARNHAVDAGSLRWLLLWGALVPVLASPSVHADEMTVRAGLKAHAARLLEQHDVAAYDQYASELRGARERTPAGIWKLSLFYKGPDNWPAPQADAAVWTQIENVTEEYLREHPDSPSAVVAYARILVSHAWAYRGSGWGRDLSETQRGGFAAVLERARAVLDQHRAVGSADPEWYSLRIQVMNGQNTDKATILALAREALDREPTYQPIDYVTANALLPKWGGSTQQLQQFVTLALAKSAAAEGTQAYARIMFNIARADPDPLAALGQAGAEWPLLRASLREIAVAYPDPWNLNAERAMACLMGTQADFTNAFQRVSNGLVSVAWFDSVWSWPECQRRQQRAQQSALASWTQAFIRTAPSADFIEALAGGVLTALLLLYLSRRPRMDEATLDDVDTFSAGGDYPRSYPMTPGWRIGILLLGGIFLLGSLAVAWQFGVLAIDPGATTAGLMLVFFLAIVATVAAFYMADALLSRIVLKADRLEIHEIWRVRRILRRDIETRQVLQPPNSPRVLILHLKAPAKRKIKLPVMWNTDSAWAAWFAPIPDVDVEASKAFEAAVDANTDLGATPVERQQRLTNARSLARNATWVNAALIAWVLFYPRPYELVVLLLAALPWVAVWIMARSPGLYTINAPRGSGRPDLTILLISPGFLLTFRALQDVQILDWHGVLVGAGLVAMGLMGSVLWAVPAIRQKLGIAALTLALVLAYGYGVVALGNAVLDRSSGASYTTTVYAKHVSGGRNKYPQLRIGAWGPRATPEDVTVPWETYRSANVGDTVCVLLRPGAFGIPWYRISRCQAK
jgi:hypothetical protein